MMGAHSLYICSSIAICDVESDGLRPITAVAAADAHLRREELCSSLYDIVLIMPYDSIVSTATTTRGRYIIHTYDTTAAILRRD